MATTEPDVTAANEKPITCPCCGNSSVTQWPSDDYEYECDNCACLWDESVRRAQPAALPIAVGVDMSRGDDMTARAYLYEGGIMHVEYEPPSQPAEAVDEAKEREAFEKFDHMFSDLPHIFKRDPERPHEYDDVFVNATWTGWLARARGGQAD